MNLQPWFTFQTEKSEEEKVDNTFCEDVFLDIDDTGDELQPTRNVGTLSPELQKLVDESSRKTGWIF